VFESPSQTLTFKNEREIDIHQDILYYRLFQGRYLFVGVYDSLILYDLQSDVWNSPCYRVYAEPGTHFVFRNTYPNAQDNHWIDEDGNDASLYITVFHRKQRFFRAGHQALESFEM